MAMIRDSRFAMASLKIRTNTRPGTASTRASTKAAANRRQKPERGPDALPVCAVVAGAWNSSPGGGCDGYGVWLLPRSDTCDLLEWSMGTRLSALRCGVFRI